MERSKYPTKLGNTPLYQPDKPSGPATVAVNNPPDKPRIDGHASGKAGVEYEYTFSTADFNGNDIYYIVDWGDNTTSGWVGPYSSNEEINRSHTWEEKGTYAVVKVKAKDTLDAESDWATLAVSMPICKQLINSVLSMFLEKHMYIFPVLRYLLEL